MPIKVLPAKRVVGASDSMGIARIHHQIKTLILVLQLFDQLPSVTWMNIVVDQTMHQQIGACLPFERDTGVNHPDAYHGVTYTNDHHRFMLTYKDKSALGWTFVTFRVFNAP